MKGGIVLVVSLRRIERLQRHHLGNDFMREDLGLVQLGDISLRDLLLLIAAIKDDGAILRPRVRALSIQLRRIMRDGEKHLEQLTVGELRRVENHLD